MRNDSVAAGFTSSLIFHKDGSVTARYGYDRAVRLLYEYERSGVAPEDAETGRRRTSWERYTMKTPNGDICARRGWECVLGRLFCYERSKLTPEQWRGERRAAILKDNAAKTRALHGAEKMI